MEAVKIKVRTFRDLVVWQKAHHLVLEVYRKTNRFPQEERFGLTAQLKASVSSVATNIVEGHKKKSRKDFLRFLNTADGSLEETKYHILLASDLGYMNEMDFQKLTRMCDEVGRILFVFQKSLSFSSIP